jgi:uncharacterized membrane protein (DUF485 family)
VKPWRGVILIAMETVVLGLLLAATWVNPAMPETAGRLLLTAILVGFYFAFAAITWSATEG